MAEQVTMKTELVIFLPILVFVLFVLLAAIVYLVLRRWNVRARSDPRLIQWDLRSSSSSSTYRRFDSLSYELNDFPVPFTISDTV